MSEKRRGLGRGLGALIPSASEAQRPVDVFFPDNQGAAAALARGNDALSTAGAVDTSAAADVAADSATATREALVDVVDRTAASGVASESAGAQQSVSAGQGPDDGSGLLPVPGARFAEIPVTAIRPNSKQPRTVFDEEQLAELVGSIREIGVLQPIVVRPSVPGSTGADGASDGIEYELIMGERRWRATQEAGLATIPAIIRETDDEDLLRDALLENLHRSQLNPLEEAAAYQQLLDDFGCTHEQLASRIHRSRPQISNTLRLLKLPPLVQRRVAAGVLSAGHARALLGLADGAAIERLAQRIVAEGLSVRATEEIVSLGGDSEAPAARRRPRAGERSSALDDLAARLSDKFETRVKIALGKSKGRLTVEFASVQDLNRILETLSPEDPGLLRR